MPSNADIKIYNGYLKTIGSFSINENNEDVIKLSGEKIPKEKIFTGNFPINNVILTPTVSLNGEPTSIIEIFPVVIQSGILSYRKNITIQLSWGTSYSSNITKLLSKSQLDDLNQDVKSLKKDFVFINT